MIEEKYAIETGVPIPKCRSCATGAPRRAQTPWTIVLDALEPGQSTLTTEYGKMKAASQFRMQRPEKTFVCRKIPSVGWRVWRTA